MFSSAETNWKIGAIGLFILTSIIVFPFLINLFQIDVNTLLTNHDEFTETVFKTIAYAVISSILVVTFGFVGAFLIRNVQPRSLMGKTLGFLILPVMIGNISSAFSFKLLWGDSFLFFKIIAWPTAYKLALLIVIQLWQFGLLFLYLFWMQFQAIPNSIKGYAKAYNFGIYHLIKDVYFPRTRNLYLLLICITFIFSFHEEAKMRFLFKATQGNASELISNWLERTYHTTLISSPDLAQETIFKSGSIITLISVVSLFLFLALLVYIFKQITAIKLYPSVRKKKSTNIITERFVVIVILLFLFIPIGLCLTKIQITFSGNNTGIAFALLMTCIATILSSFVAILFGIFSRLGWQRTLSSFNNQSIFFFVILFLLLLIPPLIIQISGYDWMGKIGYSSLTIIYIIWIMGHIILTLPLLGSFVVLNHFRVSKNELDYLKIYQLRRMELISYSFLKRFQAEYLLLFIIGFSFIWNEGTLNNLFSDYIPSFVSGLTMLITGRGADYSKAFGYLLTSFFISLIAVLIWRIILEKQSRIKYK